MYIVLDQMLNNPTARISKNWMFQKKRFLTLKNHSRQVQKFGQQLKPADAGKHE